MNFRKIFLLLFLLCIVLVNNSYCWGPLTHYYISLQLSQTGGENFNISNMMPDIFTPLTGATQWHYNITHAPYPRNLLHINDPNFAYIMLWVANSNEAKKTTALGWGGHIVSDWVAQNRIFLF